MKRIGEKRPPSSFDLSKLNIVLFVLLPWNTHNRSYICKFASCVLFICQRS
jgi:hypothetical protein